MANDKRAVTRAVLEDFVEQGFMFTALDVSNEVKARLDNVRHREISPLVRELFDKGALGGAYTRTLIDVLAGGHTVQAYLYYDEDDDPEDYDGSLREQKARPPTQRDSSPPPLASPRPDLDADRLMLSRERDGSVEIPAGYLRRAGINSHTVHLDVAGFGSELVLVPPDPNKDPIAVLDVDDVVIIPADRLSAYDGTTPLIVRRASGKLEIDGKLR